jgi:hypothetical protein
MRYTIIRNLQQTGSETMSALTLQSIYIVHIACVEGGKNQSELLWNLFNEMKHTDLYILKCI